MNIIRRIWSRIVKSLFGEIDEGHPNALSAADLRDGVGTMDRWMR